MNGLNWRSFVFVLLFSMPLFAQGQNVPGGGVNVDIDTERFERENLDIRPLEEGQCQVQETLFLPPGSEPPGDCSPSRIVCGPHFWHLSATDLCVEQEILTEVLTEGEEPLRYLRAHIRRPKRENSNEPWREIRIPMNVPGTPMCGTNLIQPPVRPSEASLLDIFLPRAFAQWEDSYPWGFEERTAVAAVLNEWANGLAAMTASGEIPAGLEVYVNNTYTAMRFAAHILLPSLYPCPECLAGLCGQTGVFWANIPTAGMAQDIRAIEINERDSFSQHPDLDPILISQSLATILVHEATHIIFSWLTGHYDWPTGTHQDAYESPSIGFEDEWLAYVANSLSLSQADPVVQGWTPTNTEITDIYESMTHDPAFSGVAWFVMGSNSMYVYLFFYNFLDDETRQRIDQCVAPWVDEETPDMVYYDSWVLCYLSVLHPSDRGSFAREASVLQSLEDAMYNRGGPMEFCPLERLTDFMRDPSLDRDNLDSPDTRQSEGGGEEGPPPPEDYEYEGPTTIGQSGSEREEGLLPDGCPPSTDNPAEVATACFDWCWYYPEVAPLCEDLTEFDLSQDCARSSSHPNCLAEQNRLMEEENQRTARLRACETNINDDLLWCGDQCVTNNFEYEYCPQTCLFPRWSDTEFCQSIEAEVPPSGDGCPSGWSEPLFTSLEITWDGCYPYIGNIRCCDVVGDDDYCEPLPGNDQNFACTEGSWCGCYENFGVVRNFASCMAPRSGGPWEIHRRSDYMAFNPPGTRAWGTVSCHRAGEPYRDGECDCWLSSGGCGELVDCPGGYRSMAQCIPYGSCSR